MTEEDNVDGGNMGKRCDVKRTRVTELTESEVVHRNSDDNREDSTWFRIQAARKGDVPPASCPRNHGVGQESIARGATVEIPRGSAASARTGYGVGSRASSRRLFTQDRRRTAYQS